VPPTGARDRQSAGRMSNAVKRLATLTPDLEWALGGVRLEVKTPRVRNADRTPTYLDSRQRANAAQQLLLELARGDIRQLLVRAGLLAGRMRGFGAWPAAYRHRPSRGIELVRGRGQPGPPFARHQRSSVLWSPSGPRLACARRCSSAATLWSTGRPAAGGRARRDQSAAVPAHLQVIRRRELPRRGSGWRCRP
jgi:hypothetical protein